jgi:hypothetical protein
VSRAKHAPPTRNAGRLAHEASATDSPVSISLMSAPVQPARPRGGTPA